MPGPTGGTSLKSGGACDGAERTTLAGFGSVIASLVGGPGWVDANDESAACMLLSGSRTNLHADAPHVTVPKRMILIEETSGNLTGYSSLCSFAPALLSESSPSRN